MIKKAIFTIYIISSLFFIACGQDHQEDLTWLQAFKEAERNTVVLNNQLEIIPLKKLEQRKIASINLGFAHSITFDSLLNKYSKVDAFNGNIYLADDNFKGLVDELKFYNTVVQKKWKNKLTNIIVPGFEDYEKLLIKYLFQRK